MKVRVTMTVDVDKAAWNLAYGTGEDAKDIREDVKSYILSLVQQSAAQEEDAITDVTVH